MINKPDRHKSQQPPDSAMAASLCWFSACGFRAKTAAPHTTSTESILRQRTYMCKNHRKMKKKEEIDEDRTT